MSDIFMGYLTESERENLIFEKEMELMLIDNDYYMESFLGIKERIQKRKQKLKELKEKLYPKVVNTVKEKEPKKIDNSGKYYCDPEIFKNFYNAVELIEKTVNLLKDCSKIIDNTFKNFDNADVESVKNTAREWGEKVKALHTELVDCENKVKNDYHFKNIEVEKYIEVDYNKMYRDINSRLNEIDPEIKKYNSLIDLLLKTIDKTESMNKKADLTDIHFLITENISILSRCVNIIYYIINRLPVIGEDQYNKLINKK